MNELIDVYNYMYWGNYNQRIQELANMALEEFWNFKGRTDYSILKNYLKYTFNKIQEEGNILKEKSYFIFNTGLFDKYYNQIYVRAIEDSSQSSGKRFKDFCTKYELLLDGIVNDPKRANYFSNPDELVFDWHYKININFKHILEDEENRKRLPQVILNAKQPERELNGAIQESIKRVTANYKLAVPQYFNGRIQLLLPLYFENSSTPSLALVLSKVSDDKNNTEYLGHTCLTMDMAYYNARLITKPESNWLLPQDIDDSKESVE